MAKKAQAKVRETPISASKAVKIDRLEPHRVVQRGVIVFGSRLNARYAINEARRDGYIPVLRDGRADLY